MLHATTGIIINTINYSETSIIAKIYTRNFGFQSYIVNGVRGKKSKNKASLFQPLALVQLQVTNSAKSTLHRISEINIQQPYSDIPYNIIKSSIAIFLNEILFNVLKEEHPDEDLFDFIYHSLLVLDLKQDSCANFHIIFMLQLSKFLGFYPQGKASEQTPVFDLREGLFTNKLPLHIHFVKPPLSNLFGIILNSNYETMQNLAINAAARKELLNAIITYFQLHVNSFRDIKSLPVLEEIVKE